MDDREVVAAIRSQDSAGMAAAYDKYAAALYDYCTWSVGQPAIAADALRDTFVIAAASEGLPEASGLRPWLYSVARRECLRRLRTEPAAAGHREAEATDSPAGADRGDDETELRTLVRAVLAGLKPRDRELVELQFRHDLHDADLAIALGVSWGRAHARAARSRGRLEKALGALLAARTGGEAASRRRGPLRPAALSSLLPLAPLPPELKERVLLACSDTAPAVLAYRRGVVLTWLTRFSRAIKPHWRSSYRLKRPATTTMVFAGWVAAVWAVAAVLFFFVGFR